MISRIGGQWLWILWSSSIVSQNTKQPVHRFLEQGEATWSPAFKANQVLRFIKTPVLWYGMVPSHQNPNRL